MSIGFLLVWATAIGSVRALPGVLGGISAVEAVCPIDIVDLIKASELHLHSARAEFVECENASLAVNLQCDVLLIGVNDSTQIFNGSRAGIPFRILICA
jgi:hypothetical protein